MSIFPRVTTVLAAITAGILWLAPESLAQAAKNQLEKIEFVNAPVAAVLDYYARLTNRSIIPAPNLAGVINFRAQTPLTIEEAIQALDSVLSLNGIATVPVGEKFLKVVQIATAKQEGLPVTADPADPLVQRDALTTHIIPLKYAEAGEAVAALQPYLHPYGQLLPLLKSNSIMVTDTGGNVRKMLEIVRYIDQPTALRVETKIYALRHARAPEVVGKLQTIIQETQQATGAPAAPRMVRPPTPGVPPAPAAPVGTAPDESIIEGRVVLTPDERTNKIFVLSRPANFAFFDQIIEELDMQVDPDVTMRVIVLDFANSEEMAALLNALVAGGTLPTRQPATTPRTSAAPPRTPAPPPPPSAPPATTPGVEGTGFLQYAAGVRILPDPRTNSLLIMATREDMDRIEGLVKSLDTSVTQVLVEVVIAEVNLDDALEVGVELVKRMFQEGQVQQTGATRTAPPGQPGPVDLSSVSGELLSGLSTNLAPIALASLSGGLTYFATFQNLKLDTVIRLLASSSKFKVLSTPIIQTMHNQEARITVGESRPVITATVADVVAAGATAVRSNVEFRDIAIELTVTPRINPDGYVTMEIHQTVNDVGGSVLVNNTPVPIITLREAQSTVSVRDQSTIVLGGLIKENKTQTETKVPFFGDIPFLGTLFKGKSTVKNRNELIVFIRPTVLRTDEEAQAEAFRRSRLLKAGKELQLEQRLQESEASAPLRRSGSPAPTGPGAGAADVELRFEVHPVEPQY
jgi:general secretion pathway protein D